MGELIRPCTAENMANNTPVDKWAHLPEKYNILWLRDNIKPNKSGYLPDGALKKYGFFKYHINTVTIRGCFNLIWTGTLAWVGLVYGIKKLTGGSKTPAAPK